MSKISVYLKKKNTGKEKKILHVNFNVKKKKKNNNNNNNILANNVNYFFGINYLKIKNKYVIKPKLLDWVISILFLFISSYQLLYNLKLSNIKMRVCYHDSNSFLSLSSLSQKKKKKMLHV